MALQHLVDRGWMHAQVGGYFAHGHHIDLPRVLRHFGGTFAGHIASLLPGSRQLSVTFAPRSAWRSARRICSSLCSFFATFVSSSPRFRGPRQTSITQLINGSPFGVWVE